MGKMEDGNFKQHKFMLLKMEILKKSQKEILAIKKQRQKQNTVTEMKNAFDGHSRRKNL